MSEEFLALLLETAGRAAIYGTFVLAGGVCAFRAFLLPRVPPRQRDRLELRAVRIGSTAAIGLVAAALFRAWAHTFAAFGSDAYGWESFYTVTAESRWGSSWRIAFFSSLALAVAFAGLRVVQRRRAWLLAGLAALAFGSTLPLLGHAAGYEGGPAKAIALQAGHVLGVTLWIGTLGTLALVTRRIGADPESVLTLLRRFTPVALAGVGLLAATGGLTAFLYVDPLSDLWSTTYGRLLTAKVVLFLGVGGCGAYNGWGLRRGSRTRTAERLVARHRSAVSLELALAGAVLLATSLLTGLPRG